LVVAAGTAVVAAAVVAAAVVVGALEASVKKGTKEGEA
jgi:hypothetical protein